MLKEGRGKHESLVQGGEKRTVREITLAKYRENYNVHTHTHIHTHTHTHTQTQTHTLTKSHLS